MPFHTEDELSLRNMLGVTGELPEILEPEYNLRRRMFHAAGGQGPLGPIGLVHLARDLGLAPPSAPQVERIDFRSLPANGSVRVETLRYGDWVPGVYVGPGDNGQIYVRLTDDGVVKEIRNSPDVLRLASDQEPDLPADPPRAKLLPRMTGPDLDPDDCPFVSGGLPVPAEAATAETPPELPDPDDDTPDIDWGSTTPGQPVWVDAGDDQLEGVLSHVDEAGAVFVLVTGEDTARSFPQADIYPV